MSDVVGGNNSGGGSASAFDPPLSIVLSGEREIYRVGENVTVRVEVRNLSGRRLRMVGVLDGSEAGERYPHYLPHIKGHGYHAPVPEKSGYTSPLRTLDFRVLEASESFDPTTPMGGAAYLPLVAFNEFCPHDPGLYELSLTLATDSDDDRLWLGSLPYPQDQVLPLIAQVPHTRVESNILKVEVRRNF